MKNQPYLAKDRIFRELHPVYVPRPRADASTKKATTPAAPKTVARAPQKP